MITWNDGYVSDIAYSGAVYREQTPAHLNAACLVAGFAPPVEPEAPFSYCELGCGLGDTALAVAAGYPHARVWGFDFNPAHVAAARTVIQRTGLTNVKIAERSFEELVLSPPADLPELDYVTLHGVWSWISPANQAHIVTFLRRHLRPGGLVCLSYNAMPGWAGYVGLQRLLYEAGRAAGGSSAQGIREAMALVRQMADAGCGVIDGAWLKRLEAMLMQDQTPYLAHEYLNAYWRPAFHSEVAEAMAGAKLTYAASANIFDNFPQFCARPDQMPLIAALTPELRRTAEDAFCGRMFRRDIYVRGPCPLSIHARSERLGAQRLLLTVPSRSASLKITIPVGEATLNEAFYGPALNMLARGSAVRLADLMVAVASEAAPPREEVLGMLIGSRQAVPAPLDPDSARLASTRHFNRTRIAQYIDDAKREGWLVGARVGSAVPVGLDEMLVYEVVAEAEDCGILKPHASVVTGVRARMDGRGMVVRTDGVDDAPDVEGDIRSILEERVPLWRAMGAL